MISSADMEERRLPRLEVCLSPALLHLYDTTDANVVIIDIFRASSTIVTALYHGAACVIPVATVSECIEVGNRILNSVTAGERDGQIAPGLAHGNSPFEFPKSFISGRTLVLTTTNGTRLLHMVRQSANLIVGSFLNLSQVASFLVSSGKNVVLACAAWKDRFNLEDTLFAGALAEEVAGSFMINCDSARAAIHLNQLANGQYLSFLKDSSHYKRLSGFGLSADLVYCTTKDIHPVLPVLAGDRLINLLN